MEDEVNPEPDVLSEVPHGTMMRAPRGRREISPARRRELMAFALTLADMVEEKTQPHERCLLRGMVEMLVIRD